jgi:hypothetical protein
MANILTDPPFAADPPIKLNVPAKTVGLVAAILGIIGIIFGLIALPAIFALNSVVSSANSFCQAVSGTNCAGTNSGIFGLALIGVLLGFVGAILYAFGGFRMYQLNRQGKDLVIYGLIVSLVGGILEIVGYGGVGSFIFDLIIAVVLYYLVVISRWPGDAPLVASGPTGGYGNPPGGYGSPPPPPPSA